MGQNNLQLQNEAALMSCWIWAVKHWKVCGLTRWRTSPVWKIESC